MTVSHLLPRQLFRNHPHPHDTMRFLMPIIIENVLVIVIGMVVSSFTGKLNGTALSAAGTGNTAIAIITALFCLITNSSAVLAARMSGSGDKIGATEVVEQALLFSIVVCSAICFALAALAVPIMRLLIPTAEPQLFDEAVMYFRLLCISYVFYNIYVIASGILRAVGSSNAASVCTIFLNVSYLIFVILALTVFDLDLAGIGIALILARILTMLLVFVFLFRCHSFQISFKGIFTPHLEMLKRLFRLGIPIAIEQTLVQSVYLIANSMVVGLGTHESAVYQVVSQVHTLSTVVQTICASAIVTLVGQELGKNDINKAKKNVRLMWISGLTASFVLWSVTMLAGTHITSFFSNDPSVISESADLLWILMLYNVPALSINVIDPTLRTGGDARFVMISVASCVWLIRLPVTYLFCYVFSLGVAGVYLANIINLFVRAALGLIRYYKGNWTQISV